MNETQRRIKAYKKALPHMKERVVAVAMLLAISATMMISASFAWATLSINPEVSGLATTIAANGNREIALSGPEGREPGALAAELEPFYRERPSGVREPDFLDGGLAHIALAHLLLPYLGGIAVALHAHELRAGKLKDAPERAAHDQHHGHAAEGYAAGLKVSQSAPWSGSTHLETHRSRS